MKRILIADDSFYQRKVLGDMVRELGHTCDTVASGEELLDKVNNTYDCVFLDLLMTGISGIDVLAEMKKRTDMPPVIVITADIQRARKEESLALGAAAFMNKIVSKEALEKTLNDVLNNAG